MRMASTRSRRRVSTSMSPTRGGRPRSGTRTRKLARSRSVQREMRGSVTRIGPAEAGFTLIEAIVATVIAVIAVIGLAFTFSAGRGMVDRYAAARDGLAAAQQRMERLSVLGLRDPQNLELAAGTHGPFPRSLNGNATGTEEWTVTWVDDPANNAGGPTPNDYKLVVVEVRWMAGAIQDHVQRSRIILGP